MMLRKVAVNHDNHTEDSTVENPSHSNASSSPTGNPAPVASDYAPGNFIRVGKTASLGQAMDALRMVRGYLVVRQRAMEILGVNSYKKLSPSVDPIALLIEDVDRLYTMTSEHEELHREMQDHLDALATQGRSSGIDTFIEAEGGSRSNVGVNGSGIR